MQIRNINVLQKVFLQNLKAMSELKTVFDTEYSMCFFNLLLQILHIQYIGTMKIPIKKKMSLET